MSTPNASGSLGLLVQHYRNTHSGNDMRSVTLKGLTIYTADEAGPNPGPGYMFAWDLKNTLNAANKITENSLSPTVIQELTITQGQIIEQGIDYSESGPIKVTMCWTDVPAIPPDSSLVAPNTRMLINELNLRILDPNQNLYQPWRLDRPNPAAAVTRGDNDVDNIEVVLIDTPPGPETFTIRIAGANGTAGIYTITVTGGSGDCLACVLSPPAPINPNPADQATNVSIFDVLTWGHSVTDLNQPICESVYDIYLDTQNSPVTIICTDVSIDPNDPNSPLTCVPEVFLDACTTYF